MVDDFDTLLGFYEDHELEYLETQEEI